jgi:hypothetical protein
MIRLIITANDELYHQLSARTQSEGGSPRRAIDVLDGYRQARTLGAEAEIVVDMSLSTADTLIEALHSRQATAGIPLFAVKCDSRPLPLALRRLCMDVLEVDTGTQHSESHADAASEGGQPPHHATDARTPPIPAPPEWAGPDAP